MDEKWIEVLYEAVDAVGEVLVRQKDWGHSGQRSDQYAFDLTADVAAVSVLHAGGLRVLSEESGFSSPESDSDPAPDSAPDSDSESESESESDPAPEPDPDPDPGADLLVSGDEAVAVLDPVDGSTNASRGVRYFSTSICVVQGGVPVVAVVHDHGSGDRYEAVRGRGAFLNKEQLTVGAAPPRLENALIAVNGTCLGRSGWAQSRTMGSAALELCYVADRRFDGYVDFSAGLSPWDYLGSLLVCQEAGIEVHDSQGRDLVVLDHKSRRTPVAASAPLVAKLMEARSTQSLGA